MLVTIVISSAVGLSLFSYQSSSMAAAKIVDIATEEARSNAKIQTRDLSALLAKQIESVANNLDILSASRAIQDQDIERGILLFASAQKTTSEITSGYSWLDKDGELLWGTGFSDPEVRQEFEGADFSYREHYLEPRETLRPYYSTLFEGVDGVPRLTVSYPVIGKDDGTSGFKGVVVAGIEVSMVGKVVQNHLIPKSSIGLIDRNGVILYSSSSSQYVGKNIFGPEVQSVIPADVKDPFNRFISESLKGNTGSGDFSSQGKASTVAYNPVIIQGNEFAIMYIVTPHELAADTLAFVEQQRMSNIVIVTTISAVAVALSSIVLLWNRRLNDAVNAKTSELKFTNESLMELNRRLEVSNQKLAEANEQLLVNEKMQQEFINVAAHELRTPVQPILTMAEMTVMANNETSSINEVRIAREDLEMIIRNARRLERLSSDILEVARIESRSLKLNKEVFDINEEIWAVISDFKTNPSDGKNLDIVFEQTNIPILVDADKTKIFEVISNLLSNATKFTPANGRIVITAQERDNEVIISVKDNGSGIDAEIMPRLFNKFATKSSTGTGLGLYISKSIIQAHGDRIWAENNSDSSGATFSFSLKLLKSDRLEQISTAQRKII